MTNSVPSRCLNIATHLCRQWLRRRWIIGPGHRLIRVACSEQRDSFGGEKKIDTNFHKSNRSTNEIRMCAACVSLFDRFISRSRARRNTPWKAVTPTRSKRHVENLYARVKIIRRSSGGGVGYAYVTLSPLTAIDSTRPRNCVIISPITTFVARRSTWELDSAMSHKFSID